MERYLNFIGDTEPDVILEPDDNTTYLCYHLRGRAPVENDGFWRICKVFKEAAGTGYKTTLMYPNGDSGYNYSINDIDNFDFKYKI